MNKIYLHKPVEQIIENLNKYNLRGDTLRAILLTINDICTSEKAEFTNAEIRSLRSVSSLKLGNSRIRLGVVLRELGLLNGTDVTKGDTLFEYLFDKEVFEG